MNQPDPAEIKNRTAPCRVYDNAGMQVTHLVYRSASGGTAGDTLCGLSRFDNRATGEKADLPGWSIGGGVFGPNVTQVECEACHKATGPQAENEEGS